MDWKKYENEIFEAFKTTYPNAKISFNQKIIGRYSKIERQVDVLIEGRIAGKKIRLVIDGKYYSKKIDVKEVDSFISMVEDIDAVQGILVTSKGYSEGAINRAYYGPTDIELDILNFEELKNFQGFGGIPYSGQHGVIVPAPFGWILDGTRRTGCIATLYQRGKSYELAIKSGEFAYVNIFSFDENVKNLDDVIKLQEEETLHFHPKSKFEYSDSIERSDKKRTLLRKILRTETNLEEYTGFVELDNFCVFCVLFTPKQLKSKNIRKIEYIIERLLPLNVNQKSIVDVKIKELRSLIDVTESNQKKADLLIEIAKIYRDIKDFDNAIIAYKESISIFPDNYGANLGLLEIGYNTDGRDRLIENFYSLSPGNRQLCDDLVRLGIDNKQVGFTEQLLLEKARDKKNNFEFLGNIYFSLADLFYTTESMNKSLEYFKQSKDCFLKCFDEMHPALISVNEAIHTLEMNKD